MGTTLDAQPTTTASKWRPHKGPQEFALRQPTTVKEILYGGQRGGGKTDAGMVWVGHRRWRDTNGNWQPAYKHPRYRALIIRKNSDDLTDWVERFRFMYQGTGAKIAYRPYEIRFPSGALIRTGHLKDDQAYTKYLGHEYQSILIEELTQIPTELRYVKLTSSCRSTIPELRPQIFNTTNPGGRGHAWCKARFVDPADRFTVFEDEDGNTRIFIPSGVEDNPTLMQNDPDYVKQLEALKRVDPDLYKAWRLGSWDVVAGQVFREFSERHVGGKLDYSLEVCEKIIAFDWGFQHKAVAHWIALTPENAQGFRRAYVYREIAQNQTNPEQWAKIIKRFTDVEPVKGIVLPHDCFAQKHSKVTIASVFSRDIGINVMRGDTLSAGARLNRKATMHRYLSTAPDGRPYLIIHPSCQELKTTLPLLQYDEKNVEDVAKQDGDDAYDACSLGLISLNYHPAKSALIMPNAKLTQSYPTWRTNKYGQVTAPNFWKEFDKRRFTKPRDEEYL